MALIQIKDIILNARNSSNWNNLLKYLDHVHTTDEQGKMMLHHSYFQQAPLEIIQKVVNYYPKATIVQDNYGWTPLHIALLFNSRVEVIEFLVKSAPEALTLVDKYGYTPLHIALERYRPLHVIKLLINSNPTVLIETNYDENEFSPLDLFNKVWHKGIREFLQHLPVSVSPQNILSSKVSMSEIVYTIQYIHDVTCILLNIDLPKCSQKDTTPTEESSRLVLHSVLSNQSLSWPFFELFIRLYASQIDRVDNKGNCSFHYMVQSSREKLYNTNFPYGACADLLPTGALHQCDDLEYFQALYILMSNKPELYLTY